LPPPFRKRRPVLGIIRFILAFCVLFSHLFIGMRINIGVVSVICFYFISGFLMRKSYRRFLSNSTRPVSDFYIDRVLKLFPQYCIVVLSTFIFIHYFGRSQWVPFLNQQVTLTKALLNLSLLPANYVFEPFVIEALKPHPIVPPAWSLSTEFHFYLLLPLIFLLRKPHWFGVLLTTMCIQFASFYFDSEIFNSNAFGYRTIFGVLTVFLFGYAFAEKEDPFYHRVSLFIWVGFIIFLLGLWPISPALQNPMVLEVLMGGCLALPLGTFFLSSKKQTQSSNLRKIDAFLGNLAYPVFISHFLSFYLAEKLLTVRGPKPVTYYLLSVFLCIGISFLLHLCQVHIEKYRIKKRGFKSLREFPL
jgi:peptidoglycan/LPS O-acetylase OafA/YrhL